MHARAVFAVLLGLVAGCGGGTVYANLSERVVQLPTGDSVEFQATGPLVIPEAGTGLLVTYYPFQPFDDTLRLRATAVALFRELRPRLDSAPPPFVGLRAVDRRAAERMRAGTYAMRTFGVIVERRPDGRWYLPGTKSPVGDE